MSGEEQKNKIGWNLPEDTEGHPNAHQICPTAPELIPNLPRIPNQTSNAIPCAEGEKYTYGCCALPPEVALQEHLLGRPINAFLNPSNKNAENLQQQQFWVKGNNGSIPAGAIQGGQEPDGDPLYIARAEHSGSLTPGKLSSNGCYISWGSAEHKMDSYEVLCNLKGSWVRADRDKIPEKALRGGYSESGEILFVGRCKHQGYFIPGKIQASHKVCYVPYGGKEISYQAFEVFVVDE